MLCWDNINHRLLPFLPVLIKFEIRISNGSTDSVYCGYMMHMILNKKHTILYRMSLRLYIIDHVKRVLWLLKYIFASKGVISARWSMTNIYKTPLIQIFYLQLHIPTSPQMTSLHLIIVFLNYYLLISGIHIAPTMYSMLYVLYIHISPLMELTIWGPYLIFIYTDPRNYLDSNQLCYQNVFGVWQGTRIPGGNLCKHRENMQTCR